MVAATASAPKSPKAPKAPKSKKSPAAHPPFAKMIVEAIAALKEKGGSSRQAILKYIKSHYDVDEKVAEVNVRRVLVSATAAGKLVRVKGAGASGSFKLSQKAEKPKKVAAKKPKKTASAAKPKEATKKTATPKKTAEKKEKKKTPPKPKKAAAPKPKKATTKKPKTAKSKKPAVKKTPKKAPAAKK